MVKPGRCKCQKCDYCLSRQRYINNLERIRARNQYRTFALRERQRFVERLSVDDLLRLVREDGEV